MGSFPMILKFDSLGWYICRVVLILYKTLNSLKTVDSLVCGLFLKFTNNITGCQQYWRFPLILAPNHQNSRIFDFFGSSAKILSKGLAYTVRNVGVFSKFSRFLSNFRVSVLFPTFLRKGINSLLSFLYYNFKHGYNIIFFDTNFNYNYIPVSNKRLLKRGKKNLKKLFKFFRVNCVVLLNVSNKRFALKKLKKRKMIVISSESRILKKFLDFSLPANNYLADYLFYLLVMLIYKKVRTTLTI